MCKACGVEHDINAFEHLKQKDGTKKPRSECKAAIAARRKAKVQAAPKKNPSDFPMPDACITCGKSYPEVQFKFRTDTLAGGWRAECNDHYNEKGYDVAYRKRQREADEAAYLARNAATHLAWARAHPEAMREQQLLQQTVPDRKFKALVTYAKSKDIEVVMEDLDGLKAKFSEPCFYCTYTPGAGAKLNGLDRVDPKGTYSDVNTVACCSTCNSIKASHSVDSFVHHARKMYAFSCGDIALDTERSALPAAFGGRADLCELEKTKEDHLTIEERVQLWASPCYLCGREPALGIDRLDSTGHYVADNVAPCCSSCNYFKKDLSPIEIKTHITYIYNHTAMWGLGEDKLISNLGKEQVPVAACDASGAMRMAFPSVATAARIIKCSPNAIYDSRDIGCFCRGFKWKALSHRAFFEFRIDKAAVIAFVHAARK